VEIFTAQGAPPVLLTPVTNVKNLQIRKDFIISFGHLWVGTAGSKFAKGINNTSGTVGKICRRCH
jgi:hypothetical protein